MENKLKQIKKDYRKKKSPKTIDNIKLAKELMEIENEYPGAKKKMRKEMQELTGFSDRQVRKYMTISKKGINEVQQALIDNQITINMAAQLCMLEEEKQKIAIENWADYKYKYDYKSYINNLKVFAEDDGYAKYINKKVLTFNINNELEKLQKSINKIRMSGNKEQKERLEKILKDNLNKNSIEYKNILLNNLKDKTLDSSPEKENKSIV